MSRNLKLILEISEYEFNFLWLKPQPWWKQSKCYAVERFDTLLLEGENGYSKEKLDTGNLKSISKYLQGLNIKLPISALLLLPMSGGYLRELNLPVINQQRLIKTMNFIVDEEIPIPKADRLYDFVVLGQESKGKLHSETRILLGGIRKSTLQSITNGLNQIGIKNLGVSFSIIGTALTLGTAVQGENFISLIGDKFCIRITLFNGGTPEIYRIVNCEDINTRGYQDIYRQILYYQSENSGQAVNQLFINDNSYARELAEGLLAMGVGKKITLVDSLIPTKYRGLFNEHRAASLSFIPFLEIKKPFLNLFKEIALEYQLEKMRRFALIMPLVGLILGLALTWPVYGQAREARTAFNGLNAKLEAISPQIKEQKKINEEWMNLGLESRKFVPMINRTMTELAQGISVKELRLTKTMLYIKGTVSEAHNVQRLISNLKQQGWRDLVISRYSKENNEIQFIITGAK